MKPLLKILSATAVTSALTLAPMQDANAFFWGFPFFGGGGGFSFGMGFGGGLHGWGYPGYGWGYPGYGWGYPAYGWGHPYLHHRPIVVTTPTSEAES